MQNVECRMQNFFRSAYSAIVAPATKNVSSFFILHSSFLNRRQTNSGVALIMVLGLLTVMVLLAVTFAISMRTERLAAGNAADTVRARELVQAGLARAMDDINNNLCLPDRIVVARGGNPKITVIGSGAWELDDLAVFETPGVFPAPISANQPYHISYSEGKDVRLNVTLTTEGALPDAIKTSEGFSSDASGLLVSGFRLYYRGTPVYLTGDDNTYYVIPIDQTHIKLANSYDNALRGVAAISAGSGTLNLKPIHYMVPVHEIISKSSDTIVLDKKCKFKTGDAVTYHIPATYTTDGKVYYIRVVGTNFIQMADSYEQAILGNCLSVASFASSGYLKKYGFLSPAWLGYASYTTNAIRSLSEMSELVTFDTALGQVVVKNRYRSGDCVAFTTNTSGSLPSPLNGKTPYYVIGNNTTRIKLATSLDNALAASPVSIALSGGSGSHYMYLTMLSGEATNYIPMSLYAGVSTAACAAVSNTYIDFTTAVSTNASLLLGKYRYLVANCSGLLDANLIGSSATERRFGTNVNEIAIENLPEIGTLHKTDFLNNRTANIRYETVRDLAAQDARPDNLFVYSYCLAEKWNADMLNFFAPVNLAGDAAQLLFRKPAITNAFNMAGITEKDYRDCMFRSLIDYVDLDNIPNNLNGVAPADYLTLPSNEKIPMINEIKFYHKLMTTYDPSALPVIKRKYQYEGKVAFEIWWPFVTRTNDTAFKFHYKITGSVLSPIPATPAGSIMLTYFTPQIWNGGSTFEPATDPELKFFSEGPFVKIEAALPAASVTPFLDDKKIDYLDISLAIEATISDTATSTDVDKINYTTSFRLSPIDGTSDFIEDVRDLECLDPRYNYAIGSDKYWRYVVQSFTNTAGDTWLGLSDYSAGGSFAVGDPVAIIGSSLPGASPAALIAGKIYWILSKNNGSIQIKEYPSSTTPITFTSRGKGNNYIKAVLDQCYSDGSDKKFKTARVYPKNAKIRAGVAQAQDVEYTIQSYVPKTRIFTTDQPLTPLGFTYVRDENDNSTDSLGANNYWTLSYLDGQTHEGDPYMCVENAQLKSPADLGRLLYSYHLSDPNKIEPWTNLTFYGQNTNQLLDVFAIGEDATAAFVTTARRGLLNPNASNIDCLTTALSGMYVDDSNDETIQNTCTIPSADEFLLQDSLGISRPLDRYYFTGMPVAFESAALPGGLSADKPYYVIYKDYNTFQLALNYEDAVNNVPHTGIGGLGSEPYILLAPAKLKTVDMARRMAVKMAGRNSATFSQLARTLSDFNFGSDMDFPYPTTELEKESLIGHSIGLFNLRQNLFTILIEAQAASGGNIPKNPARQRAVAIVWRDPYTGEMFVRHIKWLGD